MATRSSRELTKIKELAAEYRKLGFDVHIQPTRSKRPSFLQELQPDMIASRGDENIVVEVKSGSGGIESPYQQFVSALQNQPGWRFELVLTNSREVAKYGSEYELLDGDEIRSMAIESHKSLRRGERRIAALLAWICLEGVLVEGLRKYIATPVLNRSPKRLIKEAVSMGLLNQGDYRNLEHFAEFRNGFVHAMRVEPPQAEDIQYVLQIVNKILNRKGDDRPADTG